MGGSGRNLFQGTVAWWSKENHENLSQERRRLGLDPTGTRSEQKTEAPPREPSVLCRLRTHLSVSLQ